MQTHPALRVRHLLTLPFEAKVSTCATEVDTLKAKLAQTRKDLECAKEEAACLEPRCYDLATFWRVTGFIVHLARKVSKLQRDSE